MAKPVSIDKFNEGNSLVNRKNIFVPTAPVSADGKVMNNKINLTSQDSSKSTDDCEFYLPTYLNSTTPDLSELKSKIENNIFNKDILNSSNAFRLILIWLFTHVYPKMTELADKNLELSSEGAVEALKNFTQLSLISLEAFRSGYKEEKAAAMCHLWSSGLEVLGGFVQVGLNIRNEYKNGNHEIDSKKLKVQESLRDNIKNEFDKYNTVYEARGQSTYDGHNNHIEVRDRVNREVINDQKIHSAFKNIDQNQVRGLDNRGYLNHLDDVHKNNIKVLDAESMIDSKGNLLKEADINKLDDEILVRRRAILEKALGQYEHSLNDKVGHDKRLGELYEYFEVKKIAYNLAKLYGDIASSTGKMLAAAAKQQGDFSAADGKLISEGANVFMQVYNQEIQNKFTQLEGMRNVYKETFDLLAKYLENYFNAANASNLQR